MLTAIFAVIFSISDAGVVMDVIIGYALFILPGYVYFRMQGDSTFSALICGAPLGIAVTGLLIMTIAAKAGWNIPALLSGYCGLNFVLAVLAYISKRKDPAASARKDSPVIPASIGILIALYIVAVITIPSAGAGTLTEKGYAFAGLFGHDYILRALTAVALSKEIPPESYYYAGMKMHNYYLLWYTLPAFIYNLGGREEDIRKIVSVVSILNIPFFFSILFMKLVEMVTAGRADAVLKKGRIFFAAFVVLFLCSYHWMFFLLKRFALRSDMVPLNSLADQMSYTSQSWMRIILFEPQFPLAIMMIVLIMMIIRKGPSYPRGIILGLLLSGLAMTDIVAFLIFAVAYALYWLWNMYHSRDRAEIVQLFWVLIVGITIAMTMHQTDIFASQEYSNKIIISPSINTFLIFILIPMELGLLFLWGLLGSGKLMKTKDGVFLLSMIVISILAMGLVTEVLEGNVFLRKGLYFLTLPIFLSAGCYLYNVDIKKGMSVMIACAIFALPTVGTDIYALSNTGDETFTTYISKDEMDAVRWIRQNTPEYAVVQSRIDYAGHFDYSLTVCFAERKAALAHWKVAYNRYPNLAAIDGRVAEIRRIFQTDDSTERLQILDKLGIDYLFVGERERASFPGCEEKIKGTPSISEVYANSEVRVYAVEKREG